MPNGEHLEPTERERQLRRAANLLVYVYEETGRAVPAARDALVYQAHSKVARDLADWWEEQLAMDAARESRDAKQQRDDDALATAWAKLTAQERDVLVSRGLHLRRGLP